MSIKKSARLPVGEYTLVFPGEQFAHTVEVYPAPGFCMVSTLSVQFILLSTSPSSAKELTTFTGRDAAITAAAAAIDVIFFSISCILSVYFSPYSNYIIPYTKLSFKTADTKKSSSASLKDFYKYGIIYITIEPVRSVIGFGTE